MKKIMVVVLGLLLNATMASAQVTPTSIRLNWTAPGDDGNTGTAVEYDVRYWTSPITAANFNSATRWTTGVPTPLVAGTSQTTTVTGLTPTTTYYFAIKAKDESGNWAPISNVATLTTLPAPDVTRPAALAVTLSAITDSSVTLNWVSTGDDSLSGAGTAYDIRYSTSVITAANWASATQVSGEPAPAAAGTAQSYKVTGLARQVVYHFAARLIDDAGNMSAMSNVPSATTTDTMTPAAITNLVAS